MNIMEASNYGRLIEFKRALNETNSAASTAPTRQKGGGAALILEPRTIRHQERVEDLFYLLFRRTGS